MKIVRVKNLKGIDNDHIDILYKTMEECNNKERLLVCLYFMSELDKDLSTLENIENNLIKIFPPTTDTNMRPKDYQSFQASVIRGQFNRETANVKIGKLQAEQRLWIRVGDAMWQNTYLGNKQAIRILEDNGIQVIKTDHIVFDSWELFGKVVALRVVDRSVLFHNGVGVPMELSVFFANNLEINGQKTIKLVYKNKEYLASFRMDNLDNSNSRINWGTDFRDLLQETLPGYFELFNTDKDTKNIDLPKIRFEKHENDTYRIDIITSDSIIADLKSEEFEDNLGIKEGNTEGKAIYYYGKKYERNPVNRRRAIEYHGTICTICGFDFEKVYGERGRNYIEIHHLKPLSSLDDEILVDPKDDLIPVCANCHRIIHRDKDNVLSPDEVRCLIELNRNK